MRIRVEQKSEQLKEILVKAKNKLPIMVEGVPCNLCGVGEVDGTPLLDLHFTKITPQDAQRFLARS